MIKKKLKHSTRTWLQLLDKQLSKVLITIHKSNDMSQTTQREHMKMTCSKLEEKIPMVSKIQTWSKPLNDSKLRSDPDKNLSIARNLPIQVG